MKNIIFFYLRKSIDLLYIFYIVFMYCFHIV